MIDEKLIDKNIMLKSSFMKCSVFGKVLKIKYDDRNAKRYESPILYILERSNKVTLWTISAIEDYKVIENDEDEIEFVLKYDTL